jgi:hypothetical protein
LYGIDFPFSTNNEPMNLNTITAFQSFFKVVFDLVWFGRSDAQRAAKQKERKEKELEYARFNAEKIEDSSYNASLVSELIT